MSTIPPSKQTSTQLSDEQTATSAHPPQSSLDPTLTSNDPHNNNNNAAAGGNTAADATGPSKLARLRSELKAGLRQFPDFPSPGILFEDIMPLFSDVKLHNALIDALAMLVQQHYNSVDVVVGLDSRGFLFGPSLALRLNAGFVPVRKQGKLPGPCETEGFKKEYGEDFFQLQSDAIKPGQKVLVVDDIIATGGSAAAAGNLVAKVGGEILGFVFLMELDFLKGRDKLNGPTHTLLSGQDAALNSS